MSVNLVIEQGRIPFDLELKNGDKEGKEYIGFAVSVRRSYKPEGEQYYPEDLLYCKAFRANAKFIAEHFAKGDNIIVEGTLQRDEDYTPEGAEEPVKGQMYINVDKVHFAGAKKDSSPADEAPAAPAKKAPAKAGAKPAGKTPGLNPLAGKKKVF
jgi:single-strand DNA-binding protein